MKDMTTRSTPPRKRLRLYSRLDASFDDHDEDPRASLVNLVDVMLVFACGLLAALSSGAHSALKAPKPVEQGREIAQPDASRNTPGSGFDRVGEVFRDPKTGKLVMIESTTPKQPAQPQGK